MPEAVYCFGVIRPTDPTAIRHLSNYLTRQCIAIFLADLKNATKLRVNRMGLEPLLPPPNSFPFRKFFFLNSYFFA